MDPFLLVLFVLPLMGLFAAMILETRYPSAFNHYKKLKGPRPGGPHR